MTSLAFTVTIPQDRVQDFRDLLVELHDHTAGLIARAKVLGYHRERMWLQPNDDRSAQLITYLELDEGVDQTEFTTRQLAYESDFTRWFNARYFSFLGRSPAPSELLFAWDENG